eukprot:scaffold33462_cov112-Isochrysis_galbana.AAC.1
MEAWKPVQGSGLNWMCSGARSVPCAGMSRARPGRWTAASFDVPRPGWDFWVILFLIDPGSVFPVDGRDCSLRLSAPAPSPNRCATSKHVLPHPASSRICSSCCEYVRVAKLTIDSYNTILFFLPPAPGCFLLPAKDTEPR